MKKLLLVAVLLAMLFAAGCSWGDSRSTGFTCYYFGECDNLP